MHSSYLASYIIHPMHALCNVDIELMYSYGSAITHKCSIRVFAMITLEIFMIACSIINTSININTISLKSYQVEHFLETCI